MWRKSAGAPSIEAVGKTFIRIVACGQTIAHLPQSMQMDGSQIGIVWAIARFSYLAVPVGNVPSAGRALTGKQVAVAGHQSRGDPGHEVGGIVGDRRGRRLLVRDITRA